MDIDAEVSASDTPGFDSSRENDDTEDYEIKSLETYLASMPYDCESIQIMHAKLKWVAGRLLICLKSKEWMAVNVYDQLVQWYDVVTINYMRC